MLEAAKENRGDESPEPVDSDAKPSKKIESDSDSDSDVKKPVKKEVESSDSD